MGDRGGLWVWGIKVGCVWGGGRDRGGLWGWGLGWGWAVRDRG